MVCVLQFYWIIFYFYVKMSENLNLTKFLAYISEQCVKTEYVVVTEYVITESY